jgi:hypothetical protein
MARLFVAYEQQGETSGVAGVGEMLRRDRLEREEQRRYEVERAEREAAVAREQKGLELEERRVTVLEENARFDRALKEAQDVRAEEAFQYTKERDEIEQGFRGRQIAVSEESLELQRELAELEKDTTLDDELKRAKIDEIKAKIKEYEGGGQEFQQTQGTYVGTVEARLGQWTNKIGGMAPEARPNRDELIQKHEYYADLLARMRGAKNTEQLNILAKEFNAQVTADEKYLIDHATNYRVGQLTDKRGQLLSVAEDPEFMAAAGIRPEAITAIVSSTDDPDKIADQNRELQDLIRAGQEHIAIKQEFDEMKRDPEHGPVIESWFDQDSALYKEHWSGAEFQVLLNKYLNTNGDVPLSEQNKAGREIIAWSLMEANPKTRGIITTRRKEVERQVAERQQRIQQVMDTTMSVFGDAIPSPTQHVLLLPAFASQRDVFLETEGMDPGLKGEVGSAVTLLETLYRSSDPELMNSPNMFGEILLRAREQGATDRAIKHIYKQMNKALDPESDVHKNFIAFAEAEQAALQAMREKARGDRKRDEEQEQRDSLFASGIR